MGLNLAESKFAKYFLSFKAVMTWEPVQFWGKMEQLVCLCEIRHL